MVEWADRLCCMFECTTVDVSAEIRSDADKFLVLEGVSVRRSDMLTQRGIFGMTRDMGELPDIPRGVCRLSGRSWVDVSNPASLCKPSDLCRESRWRLSPRIKSRDKLSVL